MPDESAPNTQPEQQTAPKPGPHPQQESETPPWGEEFDAQKAWNTIQNQRNVEKDLRSKLSQSAAEREELQRLRNEKLTADERATKEAADRAAAEARTAADAEWSTKFLTTQLEGIAGRVIKDDDQLKSFMSMVDPAKFKGDNGEIDKEKVMGHLTALYVRGDTPAPRNWGQQSGHRPPEKPGAGGRAALEKRHGVKNSS